MKQRYSGGEEDYLLYTSENYIDIESDEETNELGQLREDINETKQNNGEVEYDAKDDSITYDIQEFNEQLQLLINKNIQLKKQNDSIDSQRENIRRNKRIQNEDEEFFDKAKQLQFEQFEAALERRETFLRQILKLHKILVIQ